MIQEASRIAKQTPRPRKTACVSCHYRKIKCDASVVGLPCTTCRSSSRTGCELHVKKKRGFAQRPVVASLPLSSCSPASTTEDRTSASSSRAEPSLSRSDGSSVHSQSTETASCRQPAEDANLKHCKTHLVEFIDQENMIRRPIDSEARVAYVGTDVSNLNFLVRQRDGEKNGSTIHHYPSNRIARKHLAYEPDRLPVEAFELPDKTLVDELLQAYFRKVNPGFPVVDEDMFMQQYHARDPTNPPSLLLLHAMLLVGAHVTLSSPHREKWKSTFFRRAKTLFDTRFERNRDTIVQAALLLTWHSDGPEDVAANSYFWVGVAARTALGLGMHRDAEPSTLVDHNKRMWRRTWWLLFQCDVLLSLHYGRPQAINLEDCDTQKLRRSDFDGCGANPAIDYVIQQTELCIVVSGVLRKLFGPRVTHEQRSNTLARVDAALARWMMNLPETLQLRPTLTLEMYPAYLHLIYNNVLILLHRPRPQQRQSTVAGPNDIDICSNAAQVIQTVFESLRERGCIKYLWISSVTALFTAMIQLNVEARMSNPILAIDALRRYDSTLHSLRQLTEWWPSATSVLHFFENSKALRRPDVPASLRCEDSTPSPLLVRPNSAAADEAYGDALNAQPGDGSAYVPANADFSHWRQLFPFVDESQNNAEHSNFMQDRDWRELYWQEANYMDGFPIY